MKTKENPADIASRGIGAQELIDSPLWWNGPEFLWKPSRDWNLADAVPDITSDDPEVKKVILQATQVQESFSLPGRLKYFSSWHRAKGQLPYVYDCKKDSEGPPTMIPEIPQKQKGRKGKLVTYLWTLEICNGLRFIS